jgi:hypothetical protein
MMPNQLGRADNNPCPIFWAPSDEFLRSRLALMPALEASLRRSREALVAMNLEGIERGTREQVGFISELKAASQRKLLPGGSRQPQENRELVFSASAVELEELRQIENRVREAARLQSALLARARYKLRVLANMLVGLSKTYRPR